MKMATPETVSSSCYSVIASMELRVPQGAHPNYFGKNNVIMTLGGRGSRTMTLIRSALFRIS